MDLQFNQREDKNKLQVSDLRKKLAQIYLGGGKKRIEKHKEKGKLTARERIEYLLDKDKPTIEIGAFAGYEMYEDGGGCPSGGLLPPDGWPRPRSDPAWDPGGWKQRESSCHRARNKRTWCGPVRC